MDEKTEILVALGVAIGVNCIPCFDHPLANILECLGGVVDQPQTGVERAEMTERKAV